MTKVPDTSPQAPDNEADGDFPVSPREGQEEENVDVAPPPLSAWDKAKVVVEMVAESLPVTIIMSLFTIWALFSDDIRLAATDSTADEGFMVVISIAFFLFLLEIFAASFYKEGYLCLPNFTPTPGESKWDIVKRLCNFGSFYFWLDWIATLSLIFEVKCPFHSINKLTVCRYIGLLEMQCKPIINRVLNQLVLDVRHVRVPEPVALCGWFVW